MRTPLASVAPIAALSLALIAAPRAAAAQVADGAPDPSGACFAQRRAIAARAAQATDPAERQRLAATIPTCDVPDAPPPPTGTDVGAVEGEAAPPPPTVTIAAMSALIVPSLMVSVEASVRPHYSVAVLGVAAQVHADLFTSAETTVGGLGLQATAYLTRPFSGPNVSVTALGTASSTTGDTTTTSRSLLLMPAVGWKWVTDSGFTVDYRLGVAVSDTLRAYPGGQLLLGWSM